jgi:hypothetical protein
MLNLSPILNAFALNRMGLFPANAIILLLSKAAA